MVFLTNKSSDKIKLNTQLKCAGPVYSDFREAFSMSSHNCKIHPEVNIL